MFGHLSTLAGGRRDGWIGLGRVARAQKDERSATEYFRRALALSAEDVTARYLLAGEDLPDVTLLQEMRMRRNLPVAEMTTLAGLYESDECDSPKC